MPGRSSLVLSCQSFQKKIQKNQNPIQNITTDSKHHMLRSDNLPIPIFEMEMYSDLMGVLFTMQCFIVGLTREYLPN